MNDDDERFRELRFLYVCGKLDPIETAWMAAQLQRDPARAAELDAERGMAADLRAALDANYLAAAPLLSFEQAMAGAAGVLPAPRVPAWRGWLAQAWRHAVSPAWTGGALALLAVCATVQTYRVEQLHSEQGERLYRGAVAPVPAGATLRVLFADPLTIGQLRALMAARKLEIVAGPDEQGVVLVRVGEGEGEAALAALRREPMVLDASVVGKRP
ncbi:hypothetical protein [Massilia sp. DWR3-1-1]|uniref:hypothetical protein n=1 Tax=Massilia sp. DWR3-1-1 TaxID=2804559 RepID=UPI003CF2A9BE